MRIHEADFTVLLVGPPPHPASASLTMPVSGGCVTELWVLESVPV